MYNLCGFFFKKKFKELLLFLETELELEGNLGIISTTSRPWGGILSAAAFRGSLLVSS